MPSTTTTTRQQPPLRILIFLDIDGVLLPFPDIGAKSTCGAIFPDECLVAFSTILEAFSSPDNYQVDVILSSTWRAIPRSISDILHSFELYGKAHGGPLANLQNFADKTDLNFHSERQHEIYKYLDQHGVIPTDNTSSSSIRPPPWIALDDEELLEGKVNEEYRSIFEGHVVKPSSRLGLTARDASMAIQLLRAQLGQINCFGV